ncbi:BREX-1 system adenine-specific DNA-methyltransferase PglX [Desulforhopalus sp. IMCC35007]|uniref:BREX-1 system adenine-specific DNA-methyltransferase PglX n=1 Tax=Desulforhopalus sp. IMCC35007 TaxID=2569543 RepID=UPI0010ADF98C|nr:BREX-1 system adenine-specific DNA-methyltransferase PglX [Desulforhopalus sp. IMCC35007]TKB07805.1 BREX-1 system adenine-specific DNA-methyltransferase PglX [Desulforhopalus sp. IMCC35007]
METAKLKKFAQFARRTLLEQVSAKLKLVLAENSAARRESTEAIKKLEEAIKNHGKEQVIERVAYIWFNRFCALRFMDVNRYTRIGVVSPSEGQFQPEILAEAKMGHIDEEMVHDKVRQQIFALLDGKAPSRDPQGEAYRLLVVAACNFWNKAMPFLFQRIDDYTELLMPDDLLSGNSILAYTREAMTPDACEDVEVIGWLYQFYISEKKDEVFDGLKKNKKITPENIPAATQLFTPHWIVRYLVENSLGRLWLLNRPGSKLAGQMDYYIKPEQAETDFLRIAKPEEVKICDPACGSGHMLSYAFDLLYAIYEEEGYEPAEIPEKILTNNLYGIEIDERAGELAAFALTMKARSKQRRFFSKGVKPNICVLENVHFDGNELKDYMDFVGRDLFTAPLQTTLRQFEEADNFGSLIRPDVTDVDGMLRILESKNVSGQLFISMTHQKVLQALRQADYLSPKYHVVIANPPYKKKADLNDNLQGWLESSFVDGKYDLYQAFILRNAKLAVGDGYVAMITMQGWMFAPRYEAIRSNILTNCSILSMAQLGERAFDSIGGEVVSTTAFVLSNNRSPSLKGQFVRLTEGKNEDEKNQALLSAAKNPNSDIRFSASDDDFLIIPGQPLVFWASEQVRLAFHNYPTISEYIVTREGLTTGSNALFLREWHEVSQSEVAYGMDNEASAQESNKRWFPYVKGGGSRRWYGNFEHFVNWYDDGVELKNFKDEKTGRIRSHNYNGIYGFRAGFTWSGISSNDFAVRDVPVGFMFDAKGPMGFVNSSVSCEVIEAFLNSKVSSSFLRMLAPTLDFKLTHVLSLPLKQVDDPELSVRTKKSVYLAKVDWDSFETSWDFISTPLLNPDCRQPTLKATYQKLRAHWREMTLEMQRLEEENNRIFIDAYGLQDELDEKVDLSQITLTCNPHYRYGNDKSEGELEALLLADTMRELVSYAVGCMFGRYALDKPGLILANQGETIEDYLKRVPEPSFPADDDNVIPMLDGDWFTDDIAERFRKFLRVAFGEEHYEVNLKFVEKALGKNGKARDIRDYFLKDFYIDHVKRYKKRPIYWLFSSPKGSFNALIYMHRYRPDTVSVVLNDYLREFRTKLTSHKNHLEAVSISASSSQGEKTKALKEIEKITKMIAEMEEYERDVLYPLATEQVEIDLDDGVKVNYPKLGAALKKIVGLDAKED